MILPSYKLTCERIFLFSRFGVFVWLIGYYLVHYTHSIKTSFKDHSTVFLHCFNTLTISEIYN